MARILAVDPGPDMSGVVVFDSERWRVLFAGDVDSAVLLSFLLGEIDGLIFGLTFRSKDDCIDQLVLEDITFMGAVVGRSVFETAKLIGDLRTAWRATRGSRGVFLVPRQDVKTCLCGGSHYRCPDSGRLKKVNDTVVKRAVMAKFTASGGGATPEIGTKKKPGPLWIMKGQKHAWSALAIALTHHETAKAADVVGLRDRR
jgi:hypothetical protein